MSTSDLVSVIMPYWRVNDTSIKLLERSLDSLDKQTFRKFELILCLDCPDKKADREVSQIIDKFTFGKTIMKRLSYEPSISKTRNRAMDQAIGEWFAFLDADNTWSSNWLDLMMRNAVKLFKKNIIGFCDVNTYVQEIDRASREEFYQQYKVEPTRPLFGQCLVHRSHLEKIGFYFDEDLMLYETSFMFIKLLKYFNFQFIKEPLLDCSTWEGSISSRAGQKNLMINKELFQKKATKYWNNGVIK